MATQEFVLDDKSNANGIRTRTATINSTDVKTEVLQLNAEKEHLLAIRPGATEAAIQVKFSLRANAVEADLQVFNGAEAIDADWDNFIPKGVTAIQITGPLTANDTIADITEV